MSTRLLIVDDHEVVRAGLESTLAADPRFEVVGTAGTGRAALERARQTLPDIALVDLRLPDMRGEDLTREICRRMPSTRVIIVTSYLGEGAVRAALDAGASGYVTKAAGLGELIATIEMVMAGDSAVEISAAPQIVKQLHKLVSDRAEATIPTPRQESVLELAAQGLTNSEIGEKLFISESTVRFHVQKLKEKFSARTKTELIAKAIRAGFIAPALEDGVPQVEL
ncbi:MAG TPA: response regulator transcription factor [Solirubrobacterales bacterium]|nr:response regulator transcription factor [Solirubrobacterales bacterium]